MSRKSTPSKRRKKAPQNFPLTRHPRGYWCKKAKGKLYYFGKIADDPDGQKALALWLEQRDDLLAGRKPRVKGEGLTLLELVNRFLTVKQDSLNAGEITPQTFLDYHRTCERLLARVDKNRLVSDLASDDFEILRAAIAKRRGPVGLGNEITRIRVLFKYAYDAGLIDRPVRYGATFKRPSKKVLRKERNKGGLRMFEAPEIRKMLDAAKPQLRAMILLGINAGFGNADCGTLPLAALDLEGAWVNYPRPKTGILRRAKLWPETVSALKAAIADRPAPKDESDAGLVFITSHGAPWAKDDHDNPVTKETAKLLKALGIHRPGLNFYGLRPSFRTVADETRDFPAIDLVMGHSHDDMASRYRERISDERLQAVADHVRAWLFATQDDDTQDTADGIGGGI
jgi:integrase